MKGTFIAAKYNLISCQELSNIQNKLKIPESNKVKKFHTTLIFSKEKNLDNFLVTNEFYVQLDTNQGTLQYLGKNEEHLVLLIDCEYLHTRHNLIKKSFGGSHDFPDYIPHISLAYDLTEKDKKKLKINNGDIINFIYTPVINGEYLENIKD